jgi:hypothetical protein
MALLVINTIVHVSISRTLLSAQKYYHFFLQTSNPAVPKGCGTSFQGIHRYVSLIDISKLTYF